MTPARKGLGQFLDLEQQRAWLDGEASLADAAERTESLEHRFKYLARFEKLLRRPQAQDALEILKIYGATCLPIPRTTESTYWSVSCLPSTSDKPLVRVNASWMELFALLPDSPPPRGEGWEGASKNSSRPQTRPAPHLPPPRRGEDLRARFILHLSDFTTDGSPEPEQLDEALLESCVARPGDVSHFFWKADTLGIKVRGSASIRAFLANPHGLRAIRRFNLTHMNRGRNAYQASHCYSVADYMLGD